MAEEQLAMSDQYEVGASREQPFNTGVQLISAEELLLRMWSPASRPSLRWLRDQYRRGRIPHIKIGHRVWFDERLVRNSLLQCGSWAPADPDVL